MVVARRGERLRVEVGDDGRGGAVPPGQMAEGRSNTGIATQLGISPSAVEKHVKQVFSKLDLPPSDSDHRRVLAVLAYLGG